MRFLVLLLSNEKGTAFDFRNGIRMRGGFERSSSTGERRPAAAGFLDLGDPIPGSLGAFETFWIKAAPTRLRSICVARKQILHQEATHRFLNQVVYFARPAIAEMTRKNAGTDPMDQE